MPLALAAMQDVDSHLSSAEKLSVAKFGASDVALSPRSRPCGVGATKNVWRKIDLWILPVATMIFFLSFLASLSLS